MKRYFMQSSVYVMTITKTVIGLTDTLVYKEDSPSAAIAEIKLIPLHVHCSSNLLLEKALFFLKTHQGCPGPKEWTK